MDMIEEREHEWNRRYEAMETLLTREREKENGLMKDMESMRVKLKKESERAEEYAFTVKNDQYERDILMAELAEIEASAQRETPIRTPQPPAGFPAKRSTPANPDPATRLTPKPTDDVSELLAKKLTKSAASRITPFDGTFGERPLADWTLKMNAYFNTIGDAPELYKVEYAKAKMKGDAVDFLTDYDKAVLHGQQPLITTWPQLLATLRRGFVIDGSNLEAKTDYNTVLVTAYRSIKGYNEAFNKARFALSTYLPDSASMPDYVSGLPNDIKAQIQNMTLRQSAGLYNEHGRPIVNEYAGLILMTL